MSTDPYSFRVHLQSLKDFALELETQLDAIGRPSDGLSALTEHPVLLGDFAEAGSLVNRHLAAVGQMHELLGNVKSAIGFAGDVTDTVADGYERTDQDIAAALNQHTATDTSTVSVSYQHGHDHSGHSGGHDHSSHGHSGGHDHSGHGQHGHHGKG